MRVATPSPRRWPPPDPRQVIGRQLPVAVVRRTMFWDVCLPVHPVQAACLPWTAVVGVRVVAVAGPKRPARRPRRPFPAPSRFSPVACLRNPAPPLHPLPLCQGSCRCGAVATFPETSSAAALPRLAVISQPPIDPLPPPAPGILIRRPARLRLSLSLHHEPSRPRPSARTVRPGPRRQGACARTGFG